jgi:cytochrome c peroxidase
MKPGIKLASFAMFINNFVHRVLWLQSVCFARKRLIHFKLRLGSFMTVVLLLFNGCHEGSDNDKLLDMGFLFADEDLQALGEKLFFDTDLSTPEGQSCAVCHSAEAGWTGPDELINRTGGVYPGAMHGRFGNRKPSSAAYATLSPVFNAVVEDGEVLFSGGNFWDGRATGYILGNPAADQAQGPFLNPVEQNVADAKSLVEKVCNSDYASLFKKVGNEIWKEPDICSSKNVALQYGIIGIAIAAYENSGKVNQFSSKYDYFLKGEAELTEKEKEGFELFKDKGKCAECHIIESVKDGIPPLFTDFTFDNLGIPKNLQNQWYSMDTTFNKEGPDWIDPGLGDFLKTMPHYAMYAEDNYGKHRVPTLRNVDKRPSPGFVKCFGHNGYFKSLEEIVHFYNTRDVLPVTGSVVDPKPGINCWPEPEVRENLNTEELGNLGLTPEEESAIVEFMKTLSDGYVPENR